MAFFLSLPCEFVFHQERRNLFAIPKTQFDNIYYLWHVANVLFNEFSFDVGFKTPFYSTPTFGGTTMNTDVKPTFDRSRFDEIGRFYEGRACVRQGNQEWHITPDGTRAD